MLACFPAWVPSLDDSTGMLPSPVLVVSYTEGNQPYFAFVTLLAEGQGFCEKTYHLNQREKMGSRLLQSERAVGERLARRFRLNVIGGTRMMQT